jgi:hypothetical protein
MQLLASSSTRRQARRRSRRRRDEVDILPLRGNVQRNVATFKPEKDQGKVPAIPPRASCALSTDEVRIGAV